MPRTPNLAELLSSPTSRRRFLAGAATAAIALGLQRSESVTFAERPGRLADDPFTLGVASGDPSPSGVVLWTRLAPDPLHGGGLAHAGPIEVDWVVARDERLRQVVSRGTGVARPELAHSVHLEVEGLEPGRDYWYRFLAGGFASPVGRTRTAPPHDRQLERLRMGFCSCANFQGGWFAAYSRLAEEELDLVLHLGDYIYETGPAAGIGGRVHTTPEAGARANQLTTLADYRNRHAQYKTDPALQAAHAAAPWVVVTDDHDVENNYAGALDIDPGTDPVVFLLQRAAAYRAFYEHMPLRREALPVGPDMRLFRRIRFGDLLDLHLLDTRQYRTDQPGDFSTPAGREQAARDFRPGLPPGGNPGGTLLGAEQERWLLEGLHQSPARWNALGNQVMMAELNFGRFEPPVNGGHLSFNVDNWDGYGAERSRILAVAAADRDANLVVLTGDAHAAWVHDLEADFRDPGHPIATEFVGTSITSPFPREVWAATEAAARLSSPWTQYLDGRRRGYALCTVTRDEWRTDFRTVDSSPDQGRVLTPDAAVATTASFVVERGQAGANRA